MPILTAVIFCRGAWLQGLLSPVVRHAAHDWSVICHEMRDPMLLLVLVAELLKFQLNGPALSLLLQLPPQFGKFDAFTLPLSHQKGGSALSPFEFSIGSDVSIRYMLSTPLPRVSNHLHLGEAGQALPDLYERRDPM